MIDLDQLSDQDIIARTLDGEAGNQGQNGITAVGNVIQNRTALNWQNEISARGVCLHKYQFSCWLPGRDFDRITAPDYIAPTFCQMTADLILKVLLQDTTGGATSYFDDSISPPAWANPAQFTVKIGRLSFYNLSGEHHENTSAFVSA